MCTLIRLVLLLMQVRVVAGGSCGGAIVGVGLLLEDKVERGRGRFGLRGGGHTSVAGAVCTDYELVWSGHLGRTQICCGNTCFLMSTCAVLREAYCLVSTCAVLREDYCLVSQVQCYVKLCLLSSVHLCSAT
jgi:hypothetical protein